jgi:hypothetical protein
MRLLCVLFFLAVAMPGCSRFTKTGRMDRAYYKQLKAAQSGRSKQYRRTKQKQSMIPSPDAPPLLRPQPSAPPQTPESPEQ